jgi:tetratricopeptide (TPR) repeat protein
MEDATQIIERASVQIDLALTHWKAGDLPLALQMVERVLAVYPEIEGKDDNIHRFLWAAAQILRAAGQLERAAQILAQAYQAFQKDLAALPDAEMRQTFAGMKHNRQIAAAHERGEWP